MKKILLYLLIILCAINGLQAQVNGVEFGKNRVQHNKFKWKHYQSDNFNTYFSQEGLGLGNYVSQIAEEELPSLETFLEYPLQRRANIIVYNTYDDMRQSNIGQDINWQSSSGVTKFVNNKILLYFDGNHQNLRLQIRQGIAEVLVQNILFGDDLGEVAANQALLDLPKWLTDGYIAYAAQNWSSEMDDKLRGVILSGRYRNFYQFAFDEPNLAGHAFWKYFADRFGKNKVSYFLYLSRIYRNLNAASSKLGIKKFKTILKNFMLDVPKQYYADLKGRRNAPKGQLAFTKAVDKNDYIRFNANPNPKSFSYAFVEYKSGKYQVVLMQNFVNRKVLLKFGDKIQQDIIAPNYPIIAWDGKGTRLAVSYWKSGKLQLFVYDAARGSTITHQELKMFNQLQDMKYMRDANTLLLSAVRSGQTDIYVYNITKNNYEQITDDVYDDLDPAFVAFPNKSGIIYSSNRPSAYAKDSTGLAPANGFNIFLIDNWNETEFKQISQLTKLMHGNARYPSQYNSSHFTFVSNENGINNRYAGFFKTEQAGIDTLVYVGEEILRNPLQKELDSLLAEYKKTTVDSVSYFAVKADSSYIFPLSNYQSSLLETRTAGDQQQVSEVVKLGTTKLLYRLKVDESALKRRHINTPPTTYRKQEIDKEKAAKLKEAAAPVKEAEVENIFQSEFKSEGNNQAAPADKATVETITKAREKKLYEYKPPKFFIDYAVLAFNSTVFPANKYQTYGGGGGPISLSNGSNFNGLIRMGTSDLFEDYKISGGIRLAPNLKDNDLLFEFTNQKKRIDWGITLYRSSKRIEGRLLTDPGINFSGREYSTYLLARVKYPFDRTKSLRFTVGPRFDRLVFLAANIDLLKIQPIKSKYGQISIEYVFDNILTPATNISKGLRYKVYSDMFTQLSTKTTSGSKLFYNMGFDARNYLQIYRNLTWAVRAAGDFSFGDQKVVYYLGGVDNWIQPKFINENRPTLNYTYQSLATNMRGFDQNIAHGNNAVVINSEIRLPVFTTLLSKPINNAFIRNFQLIQFFDFGSAWEGNITKIKRPSIVYINDETDPVVVRFKSGGIGPFAGSYGFGVRSTLFGYFVRCDAGWQMDNFFGRKPKLQFSMGLDF